MPNEFEFSFSPKDMQTLIVEGVTEIVVSGKVIYDPKSRTSAFEIYASAEGTASIAPVKGCPKPC